jgi:hypothetical protein
MILRLPGTAGKKHSRAEGANECAERGKRQVLHKAGMRLLQPSVGGESPKF